MMKSLLTVLAVSSLVVLGACKGGNTADETATDTTVQEVAPPPAPMPTDSMAMPDTMKVDTTVKDTTVK